MTEPTPTKPCNKGKEFSSFAEFYPFYLSEHSLPACRALHYIGSIGTLLIIAYAFISANYLALFLTPLMGYGCAWFAHFFIEHNRPATFKYPFYSFIGDWMMLRDFLLGLFRK